MEQSVWRPVIDVITPERTLRLIVVEDKPCKTEEEAWKRAEDLRKLANARSKGRSFHEADTRIFKAPPKPGDGGDGDATIFRNR